MTDSVSGLYIGGEWVSSDSDDELVVVNPATEEPIGTVPQSSAKDVVRAVEAARVAFDEGPWPRMAPKDRAAVLLQMAEVMTRRKQEFVDLAIREAGAIRPLAEIAQVQAAIDQLVDVADRVLPGYRFMDPLLPTFERGIGQGVILREPVGVAALITPFNFPFYLNVTKLAPALAAGCTTVLKPSPYTPLTAFMVAEIAEEIGLPPGVINVVTGDIDAGEELTTNRMVDIVSFTGSDIVGRKVMAQAAGSVKKVVLELGGKSPNVIFADADLDRVVPTVVIGMTAHCGQGCSLLTRTLVEESIHDELVARVTSALEGINVGDPADPAVTMGPLIRGQQRDRVERMIAVGVEEGGQIVTGGGRPSHLERGFFLEPTLLTNVDNRSQIAQQEIFGPVGVVITFRDEAEAIRLANDTEYGLGGGVWSADTTRAWRVAQAVRSGFVRINAGANNPSMPFGGYKVSGVGREWGEYGVAEFLESKSVTWTAA